MPKRKAGYEQILEDVVNVLENSPEQIEEVLKTSVDVVDAASEMTKDELALVSAYVKADLNEFAKEYQESKNSLFYQAIKDTIWQRLTEITDKTKVEWVSLFQDLEHKGIYQSGDIVGFGVLACTHCGHRVQYDYPSVITVCSKCGESEFCRKSLTK